MHSSPRQVDYFSGWIYMCKIRKIRCDEWRESWLRYCDREQMLASSLSAGEGRNQWYTFPKTTSPDSITHIFTYSIEIHLKMLYGGETLVCWTIWRFLFSCHTQAAWLEDIDRQPFGTILQHLQLLQRAPALYHHWELLVSGQDHFSWNVGFLSRRD